MNNELQNSASPPTPPATGARTHMSTSDEAGFSIFMRKYQNMVFSTAARLVANDAQAEDIAQEVFLKAYQHFDALRDEPAAPGWLRTVTTNLSINHLQRYRKRWRFFSEFRRDNDDVEAPEVEWAAPDTFFDELNRADQRAQIEQALASLPEHQRIPLVLYHFEDMPYDEIAHTLRISLSKVKIDILRARRALGNALMKSAE